MTKTLGENRFSNGYDSYVVWHKTKNCEKTGFPCNLTNGFACHDKKTKRTIDITEEA